MKLNRLTVLVTILIVVSVGTNLLTMYKPEILKPPGEYHYMYENMFMNSVLWYRNVDTSMGMIDMGDAVVVVTEFGDPLNCMVVNIHTTAGIIRGACLPGEMTEEEPDE